MQSGLKKLQKQLFKTQQIRTKYQYASGNSAHLNLRLKKQDILQLPSTPSISPSYPFGPYRFFDREYFIITYTTKREDLLKVLPYPLEPNPENKVLYEWINMPDSTGFGSYSESGTVIPCLFNGKEINYTLQMYLDCEPPIAGGREIWGFPKKYAEPKMQTVRDTLVGTLDYRGQQVAFGTMAYKYNKINEEEAIKGLSKTSCNLKMIPGTNRHPEICELVGYNLCDINLKEAWEGPARLELHSHVRAPTNILPIQDIVGGKHIRADITLPYGRVLHDYMGSYENISKQTFKKYKGTNFYKLKSFRTNEDVLQTPSMPHIAPMFLKNKIEVEREIVSFRYLTNPEKIAKNLPEPLVPFEKPVVILTFQKSDGTDGEYNKCDVNIPCYFDNELVLYNLQSFVDQSSVRAQNREEIGQPQKMGFPSMEVIKDTLSVKLSYGDSQVVDGSMAYKFDVGSRHEFQEKLKIPVVQLKFIPGCEQHTVSIAQLTKITYEDVTVESVFKGPCELNLKNHVNAPVNDLPIEEMLEGFHINTSFTLRKATVIHDYLEEDKKQKIQNNETVDDVYNNYT